MADMSDAQLPAPPQVRHLGRTAIAISPMAWGMWRTMEGGIDRSGLARAVHAALDAGITLLDTADIYGFDGKQGFGEAETMLGEVLRGDPGLKRRVVLATKGGIRPPLPYDQSRGYMQAALDASLARLGVDGVDLYQVHRPDLLTHPEELARFLESALTSGKVRALGVSNFTAAQVEALAAMLDTPLATTQPEISPLRIAAFENGEMDQAMRLGLSVLAWSPLGGGRLMRPDTDRDRQIARALDAKGVDRALAAYSWLMAHPAGIVPIIGSQNPERIAQAAGAREIRWTREEWYAVYTQARGEPLP